MIELVVQNVSAAADLPTENDIRPWVESALADYPDAAAVTIRMVDEQEGRKLNQQFRNRDYATNVLSFPADVPGIIDLPDLGDIVLCVPVIAREAVEQGKNPMDHWAHLVVHGVLHLLGHDHGEAEQAKAMESMEMGILKKLGISNPY